MLIRGMEEFGEDEPLAGMLVYITKSGNMKWSTNCNTVLAVGMCETAKVGLLRNGLATIE